METGFDRSSPSSTAVDMIARNSRYTFATVSDDRPALDVIATPEIGLDRRQPGSSFGLLRLSDGGLDRSGKLPMTRHFTWSSGGSG